MTTTKDEEEIFLEESFFTAEPPTIILDHDDADKDPPADDQVCTKFHIITTLPQPAQRIPTSFKEHLSTSMQNLIYRAYSERGCSIPRRDIAGDQKAMGWVARMILKIYSCQRIIHTALTWLIQGIKSQFILRIICTMYVDTPCVTARANIPQHNTIRYAHFYK